MSVPVPTNGSLPAVAGQASGVPAPADGYSRPQLAKALAKAQSMIGRVAHDARNDYHHYDYTSSEAIIDAAKLPLSECGLAVVPIEESLQGWDRQGEGRFELVCRFLLIHESGESAPLVRHWPVVPEKGRPLDKATAAASTLALAYLLRDLLLMPRVAPGDEVSARDDRSDRQAKKPATDAPRLGEKEQQDLAAKIREAAPVLGLGVKELAERLLARAGAKRLSGLSNQQYQAALIWLDGEVARAVEGAPQTIPAPAPATAPAPPATSASDYSQLLCELHRTLAAKDKAWRAALLWVGVALPEAFEDPESEDEAIRVIQPLLPEDKVRKLLASMAPKERKKAS